MGARPSILRPYHQRLSLTAISIGVPSGQVPFSQQSFVIQRCPPRNGTHYVPEQALKRGLLSRVAWSRDGLPLEKSKLGKRSGDESIGF